MSKVYVVAGLLYGDEGKAEKFKSGLVVRFNGILKIFYSKKNLGGPQAAHHVVKGEKFHCCSQFGSHSLLSGKNITLLSKYCVVNPKTLRNESIRMSNEFKIPDTLKMIKIDKKCFVLTPLHKLLNRTLEALRSGLSYGTTGMGVGKCLLESYDAHPAHWPKGKLFCEIQKKQGKKIIKRTCLQIQDLINKDESVLKTKLEKMYEEKKNEVMEILQEYKEKKFEKIFHKDYLLKHKDISELYREETYKTTKELIEKYLKDYTPVELKKLYSKFVKDNRSNGMFVNGTEFLRNYLKKKRTVIFESAQGTLLDRVNGIFPHITKSLCTEDNAVALLRETGSKYRMQKVGVFRCYASRHGNGPFTSRVEKWESLEYMREKHNIYNGIQGIFRIGPFDKVSAKYGMDVYPKVDMLSITCFDQLIEYVSKEEKKTATPPIMIPVCKEYELPIETVKSEGVEKDLKDNFTFEFKKDKYIIKEIKIRSVKERLNNLGLRNILRLVQPKFVSHMSLKRKESKEDKALKKICQKFILEKGLLEKGKNDKEIRLILDYVVMLNQVLGKKIFVLGFGPTQNDKILIK